MDNSINLEMDLLSTEVCYQSMYMLPWSQLVLASIRPITQCLIVFVKNLFKGLFIIFQNFHIITFFLLESSLRE